MNSGLWIAEFMGVLFMSFGFSTLNAPGNLTKIIEYRSSSSKHSNGVDLRARANFFLDTSLTKLGGGGGGGGGDSLHDFWIQHHWNPH